MAKFSGEIGYGETVEKSPGSGVYDKKITVRKYKGDVISASRGLEGADKINEDVTVGNSISIVADAYSYEHFFNMLWIKWQGVKWKVSDVKVQRPRLIIRLGGVYNGP